MLPLAITQGKSILNSGSQGVEGTVAQLIASGYADLLTSYDR